MSDIFQPTREPAKSFYDEIVKEAKKRPQRSGLEWINDELNHMWKVARDYAQQHGLQVPTLADIERAENLAMGHADYAAKWAYGIAELFPSKIKP